MIQENHRYYYRSILEALEATNWLINSKPYLFKDKNPYYRSFDRYLKDLTIIFNRKKFIYRKSDDATLGTSLKTAIINTENWKKRKKSVNTAIMVHEISEGYLIWADYTYSKAHEMAEYFESAFRKEKKLPSCTICPLSLETLIEMRKFEKELKRKIKSLSLIDT